MKLVFFVFLFLLIIPIWASAYGESSIPDWVKNNAKWWSERSISQTEFTNGLEFLINDGIIYVPSTEPKPPGPDTIIPDWVRITAGWWAHDQIPDDQFISAIQYLIKIGLIEVDATSPERIADEQITQEIQDTTSEQDNIKLHVLTEGYKTVFPAGKYIVDVRVFDADKYSGSEFGKQDYRLDNVNVQTILTNQEGEEIHGASGLTESGTFRYDVMAKETTLDPALWKINNTYSVKIIISLGDSVIEKNVEFSGIAQYNFS